MSTAPKATTPPRRTSFEAGSPTAGPCRQRAAVVRAAAARSRNAASHTLESGTVCGRGVQGLCCGVPAVVVGGVPLQCPVDAVCRMGGRKVATLGACFTCVRPRKLLLLLLLTLLCWESHGHMFLPLPCPVHTVVKINACCSPCNVCWLRVTSAAYVVNAEVRHTREAPAPLPYRRDSASAVTLPTMAPVLDDPPMAAGAGAGAAPAAAAAAAADHGPSFTPTVARLGGDGPPTAGVGVGASVSAANLAAQAAVLRAQGRPRSGEQRQAPDRRRSGTDSAGSEAPS